MNTIFHDDCTNPNSAEVWGRPVDAWPFVAEPSQDIHLLDPPRRRLSTAPQADAAGYVNRRIELGVNWINDVPFVYKEGQITHTRIKFRLVDYQTDLMKWSVIAQLKQIQPYSDADCMPLNSGPALTVNVYGGTMRLSIHWSDKIVVPAPTIGETHILGLRIRHSSGPKGRVIMYLDRVEQGRYDGPNMSYLKSSGETIPSHLRTGIYQDIAYQVPSTIDIYDVLVREMAP